MNEVDSLDIVDGSLTGADISTSGGNITFGPGTVLAQGSFSTTGLINGNNLVTQGSLFFNDGTSMNTAQVAGPVGPVGPAGPTGMNGLDGAAGLDGAVGPAGTNGLNGASGLDGAVGPIGPMGAPGLPGVGTIRFEDNALIGWGIEPVSSEGELIAIPALEANSTIRSVIVFGEDTGVTYEVYSVNISKGKPSLLGSGVIGTHLDIRNFNTGNQERYLLFRFDASTSAQTIFGGRLFSDEAGMVTTDVGLTPRDFIVNDDE